MNEQDKPGHENIKFEQAQPHEMDCRRNFGIDGAPQSSIGDIASFSEKDTPHFLATVCNVILASLCTYYLSAQESDNPLIYYGVASVVGSIVAYTTWEYEEMNLAFFGGVLVSTSWVLRKIYVFSDYDQLVWRLFTTWLVTGVALFLLLILTVSKSFRMKLKKRQKRKNFVQQQYTKKYE